VGDVLSAAEGKAARPVTRSAGLIVREIGEETLVYDLARHEAHCLNRTAALVLRNVDGRRSVADIAVAAAADCRWAPDEDAVRLALQKLADAGLVEGGPGRAGPAASPQGPGRREALRRLALGTALLTPVVTSLLVPAPAEAAASCIQQNSCTPARYGQPCYVLNQNECANKICVALTTCR
jgi:hypothetical protein